MAWDLSVANVKQKSIDGFWAVEKAVVSKEAAIGTVCASLVGATYAFARGTSYLNASVIGGGTGLAAAVGYNLYKGSKAEGGATAPSRGGRVDEDEDDSLDRKEASKAAEKWNWTQTLTFGWLGGASKPKVNSEKPSTPPDGGDGSDGDGAL